MTKRAWRLAVYSVSLLAMAGPAVFAQEMSREDWVKFWEKRPPFTAEEKSADLTFYADCPFVKMELNGKRPINVLLDTGGAKLYVKPSVAQELGLASPRKGALKVDSLKIGTLELKTMYFTTEWPSKFNKANIEAVLGSSFLWEFTTTFDYENKKVIFGPRAKVSPASDEDDQKRLEEMGKKWKEAGGYRVKMINSLQEPQPFAEFDVAGKQHKFGVDTGYTINVMKNDSAKALSLKESGKGALIDSLKVGEYSVSAISFSFQSNPSVPDILGADFLKRFKRVAFDYVNKDIMFYPGK